VANGTDSVALHACQSLTIECNLKTTQNSYFTTAIKFYEYL